MDCVEFKVKVETDPDTDEDVVVITDELSDAPATLRISDDTTDARDPAPFGGRSRLRFIDKISYTGKLTGEQEELYKILIDATATYIRDVDRESGSEPFVFRIEDGGGADIITGLRVVDAVLQAGGGGCDCFEGAFWVGEDEGGAWDVFNGASWVEGEAGLIDACACFGGMAWVDSE